MLIKTSNETITAITGPVGNFSKLELIIVPVILDNPPKKPASSTITDNFCVHCLAAAAGAISIELMSITPTVWIPIIMQTTISTDKNVPVFLDEKPIISAYSGSKDIILNSFQNNITSPIRITETQNIKTTSFVKSVEACPKINLFSPDLLAPGSLFKYERRTRPNPKKEDRIKARILSNFIFVYF